MKGGRGRWECTRERGKGEDGSAHVKGGKGRCEMDTGQGE